MPTQPKYGLTPISRFLKRSFDLCASAIGLLLTGWLIAIAALLARIDTGLSGFFTQTRVGKDGHVFRVIKIRTMRDIPDVSTIVTAASDPRITRLGAFFRRTKIDELPQLMNVFLGQMSFVGPRPDVPGFADCLEGDDRIVLSVRPGITGPATLEFRDEEQLLESVLDPESYNNEVLFPAKVQINREYIQNYSFRRDLKYIVQTVLGR